MKRITVYASLAVLITVWSGLLPAQGLQLSQPDQFGVSFTAMHPDVERLKSSAMRARSRSVRQVQAVSDVRGFSGHRLQYGHEQVLVSWEYLEQLDSFPDFRAQGHTPAIPEQRDHAHGLCRTECVRVEVDLQAGHPDDIETDTYYDGAFVIGAGLQFALNEKTSFVVSGDYRYHVHGRRG